MAFPTLRSLPFSPIRERHKIFAFDMMYFLSTEYGIDWKPYGSRNCFTDPLSPWTLEMEDVARNHLRSREQSIVQIYVELLPEGLPGNVHYFWSHCRELLRYRLERICSPRELFDGMVYVGRLSVEFYRNGIYTAPNCAIIEIAETLKKYMRSYGPGLFSAFRKLNSTVIQVQDSDSTT